MYYPAFRYVIPDGTGVITWVNVVRHKYSFLTLCLTSFDSRLNRETTP